MSSSQTTDSPQVRLAREWIDGFGNKDLVFVAKDLHKDSRYAVYPRSLGKPEIAREEWLQEVRKVFSFWVSNEVTYHSIIDAPGNVVVHVSGNTKTTFGVDKICEIIMTFEIVTDDDGRLKIKRLQEFFDSKTYLEFGQAIAAASVNK